MSDELLVRQLAIETTGYYCVQMPDQEYNSPPVVLVALHGFGQKCKGFMRHFAELRHRNIIVIAPQGPHQFYMQLEPKKVGFNWLTIYEKENSIRDFTGFMVRLLGEVQRDHPIPFDRVFILGFSQGVSMAYRFAVSGAISPRGVIACCADLPQDVAEKLASTVPFPVLLAHAEDDPVIPVAKADDAERQLRTSDFPVERLAYTGGHTIPDDVVVRIGDWIESIAEPR